MSDTIYREDAIKAVKSSIADGWGRISPADVCQNIRCLPSADRPQGEWEIVGKNHPYKRCPFCKRVRAFTDTRFCDWCGARMKGADDEMR